MWVESITIFSWFIVILRCDVDVSYIWTSGDILKTSVKLYNQHWTYRWLIKPSNPDVGLAKTPEGPFP